MIMNIGEYIKQLRIDKGLSQEELGKIVGVQRAAVQKWESGVVQNLKRNTIQKLASYFNVSPASFVSENEVVYETNEIPINIGISIRLKQARENKELSLSELSTLTGIAKSTLQRYETGSTRKIPMEAISTIEKVLNLPTGYLMGWENKSNEIKHSPASENITPDEQQLLNKYNQLNDLGREKTNEYIDDLIANKKYTKEDKKEELVDFDEKVRYIGSDGTIRYAAYGGGVGSDDNTIKHI